MRLDPFASLAAAFAPHHPRLDPRLQESALVERKEGE
jgi:hypothetical protein